MNKHEEFRMMLKELGLTYKELSALLGLEYSSLKSMIAPAKELPRWAESMLVVYNNKSVVGSIVEVNGKNFEIKLVEIEESEK